ncbi:hypothetical protein BD769DRAFT_1668376 [Suillus cothurnatus]|nr:hypothetical protein BD769DRAFT_1668376 [Suillus cothurnatus]
MVSTTGSLIYEQDYGVGSTAVEALLKPQSWVPTSNAFSNRLAASGFNIFRALVMDLLHEFELGVWKMLFVHLLRILTAEDKNLVQKLDERQTPTFSPATIRKFSANVSDMSHMAARNFEDLLQLRTYFHLKCSIPVFDGLLLEPHNQTVLQLLFTMVHWHGLAKLQMHSDLTLNIMDQVTSTIGQQFCNFKATVCSAYDTQELRQEVEARTQRNVKRTAKLVLGQEDQQRQPAQPTSLPKNIQCIKVFNFQTYKFHALGDYVSTIRRYGTSDSYSSEPNFLPKLKKHLLQRILKSPDHPSAREEYDTNTIIIKDDHMYRSIGKCVDCDMLMRFHFGFGVNHVYSHYHSMQVELREVVTDETKDADEAKGADVFEEDEDEDEDGTSGELTFEERFSSSNESLLSQFGQMYDTELECDDLRDFRVFAVFAFWRFDISAHFASRVFHVSDSSRFRASHELGTSHIPTQFAIRTLAYLAGFAFSRILCISHSRVFRASTCATARLPGIHRIPFACPVLILQGPLGNLVGVTETFPFIWYIVVGQEPRLCPLYCSPLGLEVVQQHIKLAAYLETGHTHTSALDAESTEVPVYTMRGHIAPISLDLPLQWTRQGHNKKIHVVYDAQVNLVNFRTIIHWADYPLGYNMPIFDFDGIPEMSEVYSTMSVNDHSLFNGWVVLDVNMASEDDGSFSVYPNHEAPYLAHSAPCPAHSAPCPAPHTPITKAHWRLVLAYLRLLLRVAICTGNSENPHEITTSNADVKAAFIAGIFAQSLQRSNTIEEDLATVVSSKDGSTITRDVILVMTDMWICQFIYDTTRVADDAVYHREAGFGLQDIFGPVLQAQLEMLLENFLQPKSVCLMLDQNGLVWCFRSKFSKALVWHIVFRQTRSNGVQIHSNPQVPLILADLVPELFRNAPHLPVETLALVVSFCYGSLLRKLDEAVTNNPGSSYDWNHYPSPATIYKSALEMLKILFQLDEDLGHPDFMATMLLFCSLTLRNIVRVIIPAFPSTSVDHLTAVFLRIEHTEDTLAHWLQTHGPEILPESLLITASLLFGLVDSHDIKSLLEVILGEVAMQMPLQEEEDCLRFLKQGGRCFMEEMMYRAQMEVSLFSKAIANLCEELNTRKQKASGRLRPNLALPSVNTIEHMGVCLAPHSLDAWLLKSNIQDIMEASVDASQTPPDSPHLHGHLLQHDDQPCPLPRLMKAWVDNATYRSYMSASLAEIDEPLPTIKGNRFIRKDEETLDALMSVFRVLDLKKQRAEAEVDMLYDAIVRIAELEVTDDGTSSGTTATSESRSPDDWFDWVSISYAPSDTSDIL